MRPSIKTTLIGLFATLAFITTVQGVVSLRKLDAIGDRITLLATNALPSVDSAHALNTFVMRTRLWQFRDLIADTPAEHALSIKTVNELTQNTEQTRTAYRALISSPAEQALYDDFAVKWQALQAGWEALRQIDRSQQEAILTAFRGTVNAQYLAVTGASRKLVESNVNAGTASGLAAQAEQAQAVLATEVMLAAALVMALGAMAFAFLGVSRPIERMTGSMRQLASGDTGVAIPSMGRQDEIGAMAATLATFRDNLVRTRALEAETALARAGAEAQR